CLRLFSDALADESSCGGVATLASCAQVAAHFGFCRRCGCNHLGAVAGNDRGIDMEVRTVHRQTRNALVGNADTGLQRTSQTLLFLVQHDAAPYFFLVSLIVTFSSA